MYKKWFVKFRVRDFQLEDVSQLGGSIEVDSNQSKTLIENNQCWEIANILKIYNKPLIIICIILSRFISLMFGFHIS